MKKMARFLAVFVFVIFVSAFPFNTASAQYGGYIGAFGGYTLSPDASWEDHNYNYDLEFDNTAILGVKLGYAPPRLRFLAFEFEYSYLNPDMDKTVLAASGNDYTAIEGDAKLHNFMFNTIFKYPAGKIHPYGGFGIGASNFDLSLKSTSRVDGVNYSERLSAEDTVFAWQLLAGVDIDLTNNLSLDIGCRYFDAERLDDDHRYDDDDYYDHHHEYNHDHNHDKTLDLQTFTVTLGLKYRF
ncbi:MAG: porin family protein [Deltaproteobacteria bacterium]|nr:porin family protein [Deltaproteobacteria bacterium]